MLHKNIRLAFVVGLLAITLTACGNCDCSYVESDPDGSNKRCDGKSEVFVHLCGPYPGPPHGTGCPDAYDEENNEHYMCCETEACLSLALSK